VAKYNRLVYRLAVGYRLGRYIISLWGLSSLCEKALYCGSSMHFLIQCFTTIQLSQCYNLLERLSGFMTICDTFCKRSLNVVRQCLNSESVLVNFVSWHAAFYSRMCSGMGVWVVSLLVRYLMIYFTIIVS